MATNPFGEVVVQPPSRVFHIGVPTVISGSATTITYKMRGILSGSYNYWSSDDPHANIPVGTTEVVIAAMIIDETF